MWIASCIADRLPSSCDRLVASLVLFLGCRVTGKWREVTLEKQWTWLHLLLDECSNWMCVCGGKSSHCRHTRCPVCACSENSSLLKAKLRCAYFKQNSSNWLHTFSWNLHKKICNIYDKQYNSEVLDLQETRRMSFWVNEVAVNIIPEGEWLHL